MSKKLDFSETFFISVTYLPKIFKIFELNYCKNKKFLSVSFFLTGVSNSSEVERMAVNHLVVGSIPTWRDPDSDSFFHVFILTFYEKIKSL